MSGDKKSIPKKAKSRAAELRAEIERHNRLYFADAKPEISDKAFDDLVKELEALEAEYPALQTSDSPTQRVGEAPSEAFETVEHRVPMLSIDNTYSEEEIREFDARVRRSLKEGDTPTYVVELKVDGVAMSLRYRNGELERAVTRGDGRTGDNVTKNVTTIGDVPKKLKGKPPTDLEVRGEVYMTHSELVRINKEREANGDPPYANPRNTTAGTIKQLDTEEVRKRKLRMFVYDIAPAPDIELSTHMDTLKRLKGFGFPVNPDHKRCKDIDAVIAYCNEWAEKRFDLDFETDGMVVKLDSHEQRKRLGATSKSPRWIMAYKFPAEVAQTKLVNIAVQVGKSGALTPVAEMEPVQLAGTTVRRASLYNFEDLAEKDLRIGDTVEVQKAGEIIPQVLRYVKEKRPKGTKKFPIPKKCPVCGTEAHKDPEGKFLRCLNLACPAQVVERLAHFASRRAMDIDGLSVKIIEKLIDADLLKDPSDLYALDAETIAGLERMGEKSAANIVDAIDKSRARPLSRLLNGLNIRHVGEHTAEVLADEYGDIDALMAATVETLTEVHEIGEVVAQSVHDFFDTQENKELIDRLRKRGVNMEEKRANAGDGNLPLAGKTLVATGTLENYTRDGIRDRIKELGGKAATSISKNTDYLLAGEKAGSKLKKAQELGVAILTEEDFQKLIGDNQ